MDRGEVREKHHVARALLELQSESPESHEIFTAVPLAPESPSKPPDHSQESELPESPSTPQVTQSQVDSEIQRLISENMQLKAELQAHQLSKESFEHDGEKVKYYTGLPNYSVLLIVLNIVTPFIGTKNIGLGIFERLLMTLMRLKLNMPVQDLAYRFGVSTSTVSRIFLVMIHILYIRLKHLIYWPEREELQKTMPMEFRTHFSKKTAVIIDCFEIFIQRPKGLMARAQTWSNYKHNNTVKFLIGITPQGSISFLSSGWGGRASDKCITEGCGILHKLLPGDLVLADRGFDIADSVGVHCAEINIPAFTRGKAQLSAIDVETTRKIAHVRIHVERVIGLVRNKYTILQDRLPIDYFMNEEGSVPTIDKIATVCCALTNMSESVVGFN